MQDSEISLGYLEEDIYNLEVSVVFTQAEGEEIEVEYNDALSKYMVKNRFLVPNARKCASRKAD